MKPPEFRWDVINSLAEKIGAKTYLEIGVGAGECFNRIVIADKLAVDPTPGFKDGRIIITSSDDYFANCKPGEADSKRDIVFIDGLHLAEQAFRDVENSFNICSAKWVVIHDTNPKAKEFQTRKPSVATWQGDVWKAVAQLRWDQYLLIWTIDIEWGVTIIRQMRKTEVISGLDLKHADPPPGPWTWEWLEANRLEALNLITAEGFCKLQID